MRLGRAAPEGGVDTSRWVDDGGAQWDHPNRVPPTTASIRRAAVLAASAACHRAVKWLDDDGGQGI
jgi:hypothetical protein